MVWCKLYEGQGIAKFTTLFTDNNIEFPVTAEITQGNCKEGTLGEKTISWTGAVIKKVNMSHSH